MAWPEKLKSGRWRGCYRDAAGIQQTVTDGGLGFVRKTDAKNAAIEAEVKARRQAARTRTSASIEWSDWWDRIAEDRSDRPSDTPRREQGYVDKHIRPAWDTVPLVKIEAPDVRAWVRELEKYRTKQGRPLAATTIRRIYEVFAMSINTAVREEVLGASPLVGIRLPVPPSQPKQYATHDQIDTYRGKLRVDYQRAVDFLLETGLRPSELAGLHPESVDGDWVIVHHVLVERKHLIRPWPKNRKTRRVPLTTRAVELLAEAMDGRDMTDGCGIPHFDGRPCKSDLVFRTTRGGPVTPGNLRQRLLYAAENSELEYRTPYSMRRGFITWAAPGIDVLALQKIAGHADKEETAGYHQLTPAELARLRAIRGENQGLSVVDDAPRGADRGADLRESMPNDAESKRDGSAG